MNFCEFIMCPSGDSKQFESNLRPIIMAPRGLINDKVALFLLLSLVTTQAGIFGIESLNDLIKVYKQGGESCTYKSGDQSSEGVCRHLLFCDSAVKESSSTGEFHLCGDKPLPFVCCPREQRISEKKCQEYQKYITASDPMPLVPKDVLEKLGFSNAKPECKPIVNANIVGGENAQEGEFPHMVALGYGDDKTKQWYCGGTLISENYVLTAAHCIRTVYGPVRRVLVGALKLSQVIDDENSIEYDNQNLEVINVADAVMHPNYRGGSSKKIYNDIGLVRLKKRVKLSSFVRPACLPQAKLKLGDIKKVQVTGWGRNVSDVTDFQSDILQKVYLKVQEPQQCEGEGFKSFIPEGLKSSQLCVGDPGSGKDSCAGDSGGPLTVTLGNMTCVYYVTGIVSAGLEICAERSGIYTNVQYYLDWIEQNVWPNQRA